MASDLKDELTCPICMELFQRPLRLPCGHSYCRHCLGEVITKQSRKDIVTGNYDRVRCPECRAQLEVTEQGADCFPVDFKLTKLVLVYAKMQDFEKEAKDDTSDKDDAEELCASGYTPSPTQQLEVTSSNKSLDYTQQEVPQQRETPAEESRTCVIPEVGHGTSAVERHQTDSLLKNGTGMARLYSSCSDSDSETDVSDGSEKTNTSMQRRNPRRNNIMRFFGALLSLSSSDGEYDLKNAVLDSDEDKPVGQSRPMRLPDKKVVARRRNRWGFLTSSSEDEKRVVPASGAGEERTSAQQRRRRPGKKPTGALSSLHRIFNPSSSDEEFRS